MMTYSGYIILGLFAGVLSGILGIGGGLVLIPAMIYFYGLSQHQAQGTTLALLVPPIGILAALVYYRQGYVNLTMAAFICIGFLIGGFFGAKIAVGLSNAVLRKVFGSALLIVALQLIFKK